MDFKLFAVVFSTIFVAELGDKTQLATLFYAADAENPKLTVFAASAAALVLTSALGVLAGAYVSQQLSPKLVFGGQVNNLLYLLPYHQPSGEHPRFDFQLVVVFGIIHQHFRWNHLVIIA